MYCDMHVHSCLSDGTKSPIQLFDLANTSGISRMALTDHNRLISESEYREWATVYPTLITGCEMSACYSPTGKTEDLGEIHINLFFYRPGHAENIQKLADENQRADHSHRINAIIHKLKHECDIDLRCTFDELRARYSKAAHIGRTVLGRELTRQGFTDSVPDAFDRYLSKRTGKAYVENTFRYVPMEKVLTAAYKDGVLPSLCHPLFYDFLTDVQKEELVHRFKAHLDKLGHMPGALECEYGRYTRVQRDWLSSLAHKNGLLISAGSDYHGHTDQEKMEAFSPDIYDTLRRAHHSFFGRQDTGNK